MPATDFELLETYLAKNPHHVGALMWREIKTFRSEFAELRQRVEALENNMSANTQALDTAAVNLANALLALQSVLPAGTAIAPPGSTVLSPDDVADLASVAGSVQNTATAVLSLAENLGYVPPVPAAGAPATPATPASPASASPAAPAAAAAPAAPAGT